MEHSRWFKPKNQVHAQSKISMESAKTGSNLLSSMASLSPSQLDQAIMNMLNIKKESLTSGFCHANPITKQGKRMQLLNMLCITMVPITILLVLACHILRVRVGEYNMSQDVANTIKFSIEVTDLVHNLQRERDMSALYVSAIGADTKQSLVAGYSLTDASLDALQGWSSSIRQKGEDFKDKVKLQNFLNRHRYELDSLQPTQHEELEFYTAIIEIFMSLFAEQITEAQAGIVWKHLVALQDIMDSKEMFGIERALGSIYYIRGYFKDRADYLLFVSSQDIANATLNSSVQYSTFLRKVYNGIFTDHRLEFDEVIRRMRFEIRQNPFPVNATRDYEKGRVWYDSMTLYLDLLLNMQKETAIHIANLLTQRKLSEQKLLIGMGVMTVYVLTMCPLILNAVMSLTRDIQSFSASLALRTKALDKEKKRTDTLLYQMLPKTVAEQLKNNEAVSAESFNETTIFFSDIVGFTSICSKSSPIQVINMLDNLYSCFDDRIQLYDVYKVETIGDAYMLASGLPHRNGKRHAAEIATLSLDLLNRIYFLEIPHLPGSNFKLRIGCHSGPAVAGIVGIKMPRYCLFGSTVMMAAHMEQSGAAGRIHISEATWNILKDVGGFSFQERAEKKLGENPHLKQCKAASEFVKMRTFWLLDRAGMERPPVRRPSNVSNDSNSSALNKAGQCDEKKSSASSEFSVTLV